MALFLAIHRVDREPTGWPQSTILYWAHSDFVARKSRRLLTNSQSAPGMVSWVFLIACMRVFVNRSLCGHPAQTCWPKRPYQELKPQAAQLCGSPEHTAPCTPLRHAKVAISGECMHYSRDISYAVRMRMLACSYKTYQDQCFEQSRCF